MALRRDCEADEGVVALGAGGTFGAATAGIGWLFEAPRLCGRRVDRFTVRASVAAIGRLDSGGVAAVADALPRRGRRWVGTAAGTLADGAAGAGVTDGDGRRCPGLGSACARSSAGVRAEAAGWADDEPFCRGRDGGASTTRRARDRTGAAVSVGGGGGTMAAALAGSTETARRRRVVAVATDAGMTGAVLGDGFFAVVEGAALVGAALVGAALVGAAGVVCVALLAAALTGVGVARASVAGFVTFMGCTGFAGAVLVDLSDLAAAILATVALAVGVVFRSSGVTGATASGVVLGVVLAVGSWAGAIAATAALAGAPLARFDWDGAALVGAGVAGALARSCLALLCPPGSATAGASGRRARRGACRAGTIAAGAAGMAGMAGTVAAGAAVSTLPGGAVGGGSSVGAGSAALSTPTRK